MARPISTFTTAETPSIDEQMHSVLQQVFGYHEFRPLQADIIRTIASGNDAFVLMPTGGGKSLCYQIPALLLPNLTVVVSPLIALMKDQVDALREAGVRATFINSSLTAEDIRKRQQEISNGAIKLLYVAPERFASPGFTRLLQGAGVSLIAIDEAHCVSEWGHDFRPDYRELRHVTSMFPDATVAAFTATATEQVQADIRQQLGLENAQGFLGSFNRPNLLYSVVWKRQPVDQLIDIVRSRPGQSGIVYCLTRKTTEQVAEQLQASGIRAAAYHAGLDANERDTVQEAFLRDDVQVVVATIAFGMGIDKPDVRFVIHHDLPKNLEGYYQESGRAGRDGDPADCILLYRPADADRHEYFIDQRTTVALRNAAMRQLAEVVDWADATDCRRRRLLAYFGETFDRQAQPCCDICTNPPQIIDYTIEAQKFLSCVKRTGERFGSAYIIDVLRGSKAKRIVQFRHDRLSTWGIGMDHSPETWQYIAHALVKRGFAHRASDAFNAVRITDAGYEVLFRGAQVMLPESPSDRDKRVLRHSRPQTVMHSDLFEALRFLRKQLATERNVPPYVIFPDSTLRQLTAVLPTDETSFRSISGIGDRKAREFSAPFLEVIGAYIERTGARPTETVSAARIHRAPRQRRPGTRSPSVSETVALYRRGLSIDEIAIERGLTAFTVEGHIADAIESDDAIDIDRLVPPERRRVIADAIADVGDERLRDIRERIGEEYLYPEIKFTRAWLRARSSDRRT